MKSAETASSQDLFVCAPGPIAASCRSATVPKAKYLAAMADIFKGDWPTTLRSVKAQRVKTLKELEKVLSLMPNAYVACPRG
jgi:hypothetical protein